MNNKITLLFLLAIFILGCDKDRTIEMASESLTENDLKICENQKCPEITINYLVIFGKDAIADQINKKINNFIIESLMFEEDSSKIAKSIDEAATNFAKVYFEDKSNFPDMAADYSAEISVSEIYNSPTLISFEMRQYLYTGGAHGFGSTSFLNIDPKTGKELTLDELVKNKEKFNAFAEKEFRKQQNIHKDQSINEPGFWFEEDEFHLPETVGFTSDSLIFVYNQYDIASYADGQIELKIALTDAAPFLNKPEK